MKDKYNIKFAYIFASQATEEASENSDVDIVIYLSGFAINLFIVLFM
ncbi:nucleotidyltransferase domain-containing protein [Clostridium sp. AWRP]|nr:nucleotidyltransferase domain-containing protein [Clostridium sp. AWRP]